MRPSDLLLDTYWVEELCFTVDPKYNYDSEKGEPQVLPSDLVVNVQPSVHQDDPHKWFFRLEVRLDDTGGRLPYFFSVKLDGFFEVSKDCEANLVDRLARVNAPSILYSAARELIAIVSGRARNLSMLLPTVTFFEPPATTAAALTSAAEKKLDSAPTRKALPKNVMKKVSSKKGAKKKATKV